MPTVERNASSPRSRNSGLLFNKNLTQSSF
uniref:Uncharacterized protein n=1 Tax=Rhizophora mucronata TaxID=61149 RepID=A0A2P2PXA7_RHIMU